MSEALESLARRVEDDPFFLAPLLSLFARSEKMDDARLAGFLGCPPGELAPLRLCRAPRPDPRGFQEDVRLIAERFGLSDAPLARAARRGQAIQALQTASPQAHGSLLAARDREDEGRPTEGCP